MKMSLEKYIYEYIQMFQTNYYKVSICAILANEKYFQGLFVSDVVLFKNCLDKSIN